MVGLALRDGDRRKGSGAGESVRVYHIDPCWLFSGTKTKKQLYMIGEKRV